MNLPVGFKALFRRSILALLIPFVGGVLAPSCLQAQDTNARRKLVTHASAPYPQLARTMGLAGVVKVDAVVAADGTVRTIDVKGGHPVLAQAAANTIRQWKWEPAPHESHEVVEIRFSPAE